ncbi:MAG: site-2 protease family protein, partial [Magnetococcales bacterium]|nr:site-2 protease family protein [Magnetococcales bacterium]
LPIPILDGGHLFFFVVEALKGSPLSDRVQGVANRIGLAMLGSLMLLAFYNDIVRLVARNP